MVVPYPAAGLNLQPMAGSVCGWLSASLLHAMAAVAVEGLVLDEACSSSHYRQAKPTGVTVHGHSDVVWDCNHGHPSCMVQVLVDCCKSIALFHFSIVET